MRNLTIIHLYDDNNLHFNQDTNQYELTIQYCKDNYETTFKNDGTLLRRIKLNSQVVYNFIKSRVAQVNKPVVDFLLHRTEQGRKLLLEMLDAQMYADITTGYNDLMFQPTITFGQGQDKDRTNVNLNAVCPACEQVFNNSDSLFGIRLSYQGQFPASYFIFIKGQ